MLFGRVSIFDYLSYDKLGNRSDPFHLTKESVRVPAGMKNHLLFLQSRGVDLVLSNPNARGIVIRSKASISLGYVRITRNPNWLYELTGDLRELAENPEDYNL